MSINGYFSNYKGTQVDAAVARTQNLDAEFAAKVDKTITVNGQPLSSSVVLTASDVGALADTVQYGASIEWSGDMLYLKDQDGTVISSTLPASLSWGSIPGDINSQADLMGLLNAKGDKTVVEANSQAISIINGKIPASASSSNQLVDKQYVDSSISTSTADFDGSWATYAAVPSTVEGFTDENLPTPSNNNYLVVLEDETQDGGTWRYKYYEEGNTYAKANWKAEYRINESPLTQAQIDALNSGITANGVALIGTALQPGNNISLMNNNAGYVTANAIGTGVLTIQKNGTDVQTFNANASSNATANITVPTAISDLTDDTTTHPIAQAGTLNGLTASITELNYVDGVTSSIQEQIDSKQDKLTAGTGISIDEVSDGSWSVAVEDEGLMYADSDGYWNSLTYGNEKFVAIHSKGFVSNSTDGSTWTNAVSIANLGNHDWKGIIYDGTKFVVISGSGYVSTSTDGSTWIQAVEDPNLAYTNSEGYWGGLIYDGTKFVALHSEAYTSTSTDGITWTESIRDTNLTQYTGSDGYWANMVYGNDIYVALNGKGYVSTSSNGFSWNEVTHPFPESYGDSDGYWNAITFTGTEFKALHSEGYISTSADGITWTTPTPIVNLGNEKWNGLASDASRLAALGSKCYVSTSLLEYKTVISCTVKGTVTSVNNNSPDSNGNVTLTLPTVNNAALTIQKNGTNVTTFTANSNVARTANITVPVSISDLTDDTDTYPLDKADTLTNLTATIAELNVLDGITASTTELNYVDGVTSNIQTQLNSKQDTLTGLTATVAELNVLDGITATTMELNYTDGVTSNIQDQLDSKQDKLTAGTGISIDEVTGGSWGESFEVTNISYIDSNGYNVALTYGADKFVALTKQGYISTSTNGETWTLAAEVSNLSTYSGYWQGISYGANKFVAISQDGYASTSTNGTTWIQATQVPNWEGVTGFWRTSAYGANKFVAMNNYGYVSTSTDGTTWSSATQDSNLAQYSDSDGYWSNIAYGNNKFVALNGFGYTSTSTDGITWSVPASPFNDLYVGEQSGEWDALGFDGSKFIAISALGYVSTSTDGTTWTEATQDANLTGNEKWTGLASNGTTAVAIGDSSYASIANVGSSTIISCTVEGTVKSVNNTLPDANGNVSLTLPITINSITTLTSATINLSADCSIYKSTPTSALTYVFNTSGLSLTNSVAYTFELYIDMATLQTLTFPSSVIWQDGVTPSMPTTGTYFLVFRTVDSGAHWFGNLQGMW